LSVVVSLLGIEGVRGFWGKERHGTLVAEENK
jgi:hypothetical protein